VRPLETLFFAALALYTVATWADRRKGELRPWMVLVFGSALAADLTGTVLLCAAVTDAWRPTLHMLTGTASLAIMALHFAWALLALRRGGPSEARFRRWSVWAWALWLVSFVSGAVIR
jgi:uncharacterized repeat protein (TIGR03987 family)